MSLLTFKEFVQEANLEKSKIGRLQSDLSRLRSRSRKERDLVKLAQLQNEQLEIIFRLIILLRYCK